VWEKEWKKREEVISVKVEDDGKVARGGVGPRTCDRSESRGDGLPRSVEDQLPSEKGRRAQKKMLYVPN